ncbi:WXG100 family type VII secretion target [Williamsia sp.]|uniref:WXG100 family type VII secretion target n=1 Tax=Williamsia sp. TaxID=1872085 RepID=UPI0025F882A2|nr:WXG100 family type VII secretion target [Williamsia sp.]
MTMKYNFGEIHGLADSLQQQGQHLISQTEQLEQTVAQFRGSFTGSASDAYDAAISKWKNEMGDTQQILAKISSNVREGADHMNQTDISNSNALGG